MGTVSNIQFRKWADEAAKVLRLVPGYGHPNAQAERDAADLLLKYEELVALEENDFQAWADADRKRHDEALEGYQNRD